MTRSRAAVFAGIVLAMIVCSRIAGDQSSIERVARAASAPPPAASTSLTLSEDLEEPAARLITPNNLDQQLDALENEIDSDSNK